MAKKRIWLALLTGCSLLAVTPGVTAQQSKPSFDVASFRRRPGPPEGITTLPFPSAPRPGGILDLRNTTVARLIMYAYDVLDSQVEGGPAWVRNDRFDISGRAGGDVPVPTLRLMVQSLLADRFTLVVHEVQREMPSYALVLARTDGSLGPNLRKNDDNCQSDAKKPSPLSVPGAVWSAGCGSIDSVTLSARALMNAPVVNKTGLTGNFEWSLYWDGQGRFFGEPGDAAIPTRASNLPLYPTALQEQLGLRLEQSRAPLKVVIIDSVQPPTDN